MSAPDNSGSNIDKPGGLLPQAQLAIQKSGGQQTTFPIDLATAKITHIKSGSMEGIKVAPVIQGGPPTTATYRINGQPNTVRLLMPQTNLMSQAVIKQIDGTAVRTQITSLQGRTIPQTSITVSRPVTQTTYIPRTGSATNMQPQRLSTPVRVQTPPTVTGSFVRGTVTARNSSSPVTTVIAPATTTWMAGAGQVQLIRAISHQSRQRMNITSPAGGGTTSVVAVAQNSSPGQTQQQQQSPAATIQTVTSQQGQQTFVASLSTVLPQRQQTATLVYTNSQNQPYTPTAGTAQRFVATSLAGNQRPVRPTIQLGKHFPTAKLSAMNTANISIRAPSLPVIGPVINTGATSGSGAIQARSTSANVNISTASLSATRIIQLQQQPGTGRITTNNLMLQPIIMNASSAGKIGVRPSTTMSTKQSPLTITQLGNLGKIASVQPTSTSTSASTIASTMQTQSQQAITQIVNVSHSPIVSTQTTPTSATVVRTSNVISGTIGSLKTVTATINKVIPEIISSNQQPQQPASVFIHARSTVAPGAGNSGTPFLPPGSTFYYESVPASSVSTGVLSLTTNTITSGTVSAQQTVTATNLAPVSVSSIPYNSATPGTFAVVPASNGRTIGQIQIPSSSTASGHTSTQQNVTQIQAVRFNPQLPSDSTHQIIQGPIASKGPHHQIITIPSSQVQQQPQQPQHTTMLIPVQTTMKLPTSSVASTTATAISCTSSRVTTLTSVGSAFIRKRDNEGSPIRAAKNLAPTLLSMGVNQPTQHQQQITQSLVCDSSKDRAVSPHSRPPSSDGSTTVSANSSPGVDQQINEELTPINRMTNESHFNPINEMYANHPNTVSNSMPPEQTSATLAKASTNGASDTPPKKKLRRSTNDSQQSSQSVPPSLPSLQAPQPVAPVPLAAGESKLNPSGTVAAKSNKENTKPAADIILRKPRSCRLLSTYKQNWKPATNHFIRHSDVKPRVERRPTVMDLANQAHVVQKINGWKIYHLTAQMEDLCEIETQVYDKLTAMLTNLEKDGPNEDIDRINDLVKGNIQRSKIIVDGVVEARNQIMKIFDHKSHVSDIIHRCASKRNFKKREKT